MKRICNIHKMQEDSPPPNDVQTDKSEDDHRRDN
jgi:hypothetical protein